MRPTSLQPLSQVDGSKKDAYFQFQNELLDDPKMMGEWQKVLPNRQFTTQNPGLI